MNPDVAAAVDHLRAEGALTASQARLFARVAGRDLVSVRLEVRAALYVGVLLLTSGVGLFVKENRDRIGPVAIGLTLFALASGCLVWAWRHARPFAWGETASPHPAFDYVLLLGALLVATDLAYLETQVRFLGPNWAFHLLAIALFYTALAYRFDSRMLLSLALASFAAWRGVAVSLARTSLGEGDPARLRVEALSCGALFVVLGIVSERTQRKAHFEDVYVNGGLLLALGGLLSGVFARTGWEVWLIALVAGAGATAFFAFRAGRTLPFALAVVAAWLGLQRLIFEVGGGDASGALLIAAMSAGAALWTIVVARRRMRVP